jgi:SAM-dependent methyltransferase
MPTVTENKRYWDGLYSWNDGGEEWSRPWGGVASQWYATVLPRIYPIVPVATVLEIGCGYGRWTHFLKGLCERLILVDLSTECVATCKKRFSGSPHIEYHLNDGKSLDMIADASVDFVFSFDSLVHADTSVVSAYVRQLARILSRDGVAFLHHSNLGEYRRMYSKIRRIPKLKHLLVQLRLLDPYLHLRDPDVSAADVERLTEESGLRCISQEIIHWRTSRAMIDCLSTIVKQGSSMERSNRVLRNAHFMREAENALRLSQLYNAAAGSGIDKSYPGD